MLARTSCFAVCLCALTVSAGTDRPTVEIETSVGSMTVELRPDKAPHTVANFLELVDAGFYEGLIFHRVIAAFVIQAGGFDAAMSRREPPRTVVNESVDGLLNERGTIAMARHSDPDSAGAQFYINMADNPSLDAQDGAPGYTVFGKLIGGYDVAERIELTETGLVGSRVNVPVTPIAIIEMRRLSDTAPQQQNAKGERAATD